LLLLLSSKLGCVVKDDVGGVMLGASEGERDGCAVGKVVSDKSRVGSKVGSSVIVATVGLREGASDGTNVLVVDNVGAGDVTCCATAV
jgi:hypothetical protein